MPKQHVIFGRPVPRISSRRISLLLAAISIFAIFSLIISLPSAIPTGPSLSKFTDHKFSIPKLKGSSKWPKVFNPFKPPAHPPARQKNDTDGESSWYSNWRWLSIPFSSTITLDEGRSLLPDLQERPPIYCYYDTTVQKDAASKNAESALLLTWRRAWWYHGFRPVILSAAEAMNNPLYEELQRMEMESSLKTDLMTWLAWENMGGGLLSNYLVLPMSKYDDPLLTFLRRGEYPSLTRFRGLDNGLFVGPKNEIASAIKLAMQSHEIKAAGDIISVLPVEKEGDPFTIDNTPESLAFYNAKALERRFTKLGDLITKDRAAGLRSLNKLINAHLHTTWQNTFPDGIAVLKPVPKHTTKMIEPAWDLANRLAQCNDSPAPSTCPPNQERCVPCVSANVKLYTPAFYRNNTSIYTIGTVPHPYTFQTLAHMKESLDVPWVRRKSERDAWIIAVTRDILGDGMAGGPRLLKFKEAVAGPVTHTHSLWVEAERGIPEDIVDWHFGFAVPQLGEGLDSGRSETPVPGPERRPQPEHDKADGPIADPEELKREPALLEKARAMGRSKDKRDVAIRNAVEAWNLADTEAWRFARAFLARSQVERTKWEEEEAKYAEGVGSDKGHAKSKWGRWLDRGSK